MFCFVFTVIYLSTHQILLHCPLLTLPGRCNCLLSPTLETRAKEKRQGMINETQPPTHAASPTNTPDYIAPPVVSAALWTSFPTMLSHKQSWSSVTAALSQFWSVFSAGQLCGQGCLVWLQSCYFQNLTNNIKWGNCGPLCLYLFISEFCWRSLPTACFRCWPLTSVMFFSTGKNLTELYGHICNPNEHHLLLILLIITMHKKKYQNVTGHTHPKEPAGAEYAFERPCTHSPQDCHVEASPAHIVLFWPDKDLK